MYIYCLFICYAFIYLGIAPDSRTIAGVLNACSHAMLVDEALAIYKEYVADGNSQSVQLSTMLQTCMVDILARAGKIEEAESFVLSHIKKPNILFLKVKFPSFTYIGIHFANLKIHTPQYCM